MKCLIASLAIFVASCACHKQQPEGDQESKQIEEPAKSEATPRTPTSDTAEEPGCEARVARMTPLLQANAEVLQVPPPYGIAPLRSSEGRPVSEPILTVTIDKDGGLFLMGGRVESYELTTRVARIRSERNRYSHNKPFTGAYLWVDEATPVQALGDAVAKLPKDLEARLMVVGETPPLEPLSKALLLDSTVATLESKMDGLDLSMKAVTLAEALQTAIGACTPLIRLFGDLAGADASQKGVMLAEGAPQALLDCKCKVVNANLLEYALYDIIGMYDAPTTWLPIPSDKAGARVVADLL
jgi:hypothetical protein